MTCCLWVVTRMTGERARNCQPQAGRVAAARRLRRRAVFRTLDFQPASYRLESMAEQLLVRTEGSNALQGHDQRVFGQKNATWRHV